jgi:hypothetical protein
MIKQWLIAVLVVVAGLGIAQAQTKKGANGGQMAESQGHPIEFVSKEQEIVFYLSDDDGSPLQTKAMHGRATVQDGGKTTTVALQPAAPNMLVGKLQTPLGSKARVVFSATLKEGGHTHTLTARYVTD